MYFAYITSSGGADLWQLSGIQSLEVTRRLSDVSTASFRMSLLRENGEVNDSLTPELLRVWNRIELTVMEGQEEQTLIDGIIRAVSVDLGEVTVEVSDQLEVLRARILWTDTTLSGTVSSVVASLLNTTNSRFPTDISLISDDTSSVSKTYSAGATVYDAIASLRDAGVKFRYSEGLLEVGKNIGTDRSTGDSPLEFVYDIRSPYERSLSNAILLRSAETVANAVLYKNATGALTTAEDMASRETYGLIERFETASETSGSAIAEAAAYLDERSEGVVELTATPVVDSFFAGEVGDTVALFVYGPTELVRYDGIAIIQEKSYRGGGLPEIRYTLSTSLAKTRGFLEKIREMNDRLRLIERRG